MRLKEKLANPDDNASSLGALSPDGLSYFGFWPLAQSVLHAWISAQYGLLES